MSTTDDDRDPTRPDLTRPELADSAMASGSDAGEPGEHLGPADLLPDEQRLLEELSRDVSAPAGDAAEDDLSAVRAAEDEGPLPAHGGAQDDGLNAVFEPPREA